MSVYVVILCDLYQDHFMGVFTSRSAAERYITGHEPENGEQYLISEERVLN